LIALAGVAFWWEMVDGCHATHVYAAETLTTLLSELYQAYDVKH